MEVLRVTDSMINGDNWAVNPTARIMALFVNPGTTAFHWCMGTSNSYNDFTDIYSYPLTIGQVYELRIDVNPTDAKFYV